MFCRPSAEKCALLRKASLVVIDDVQSMYLYHLEAIDKYLRSLLRNEQRFGGKVIVLSGDFGQLLPVNSWAGEYTCNASWWRTEVTTLSLDRNMRLNAAVDPNVRADYLALLEKIKTLDGEFLLPEYLMSLATTIEDFVAEVLFQRSTAKGCLEWRPDSLVVTAVKDNVHIINEAAMKLCSGKVCWVQTTRIVLRATLANFLSHIRQLHPCLMYKSVVAITILFCVSCI